MTLPQELESKDFLDLLSAFIRNAENLQNNPPDFIASEDLVANDVIKYLEPYTSPKGPLEVRKITYVENRSNLIIKYAGTSEDEVISFVGSHMDVVPADPKTWKRYPFKLLKEGDILYGRGVTDCLGHVALLCNLFKQLAILKPSLKKSIVAVFISNEENSSVSGIGIDELEKNGELDFLKNGPLYWVDTADFGPTIGTGGANCWELTCKGKLFHSGFPHNAINAIELAMAAVQNIQKWFHEKYPSGDDEKEYKYAIGSSLKPTQISVPSGGLNQIPGECTVKGDIRLTPFHKMKDVVSEIDRYVASIDPSKLLLPGGYGTYELPEENLKGSLELKWIGHPYCGIAVNLNSVGYKALHNAIVSVRGEANPSSLTGSLPCVADLQDAGFDVQLCGFGRMSAYHAENEFGHLSEFEQGFQVFAKVIETLEAI